MERIHSPAESDEFVSVSYVATKPRKRDFLRVLLGRYVPEVRRVRGLTAAAVSRELKRAWTPEAMQEQFYTGNPLLAVLQDERQNPDD